MSKTFDILDHSLLLSIFSSFGFLSELITCLGSYFRGLLQFVQCKGCKSNDFIATSGLSQGSILGPLILCLFINSIVSEMNVRCLMYADDLKIFYVLESQEDCSNV